MQKVEILIILQTVQLTLYLLIRLKNGEIKRSHQIFMHPGLVLGILVPELPLPGKHKIDQKNSNDVNQNNLDGIPEFGNAFCPVHGVKLKYLLQLLTSPLYFCSKACKLHKLLKIQIMTKGTTFHAYIPIRFEPGNTSVMISQLLFGEEFTLIERSSNWLSISLDFDGTEGWVCKEFVELREIENGKETSISGPVCLASLPSTTVLDLTLGQQRIVPAGAVWNSERNNSVFWYGHSFELLSGEGIIKPGKSNNLREIGKRLVSLP
ncbi:MAG: SH3 domain-containing protein, partial [Bacteroidales bacterium]|nr:SH3 domain-containing protein [Bacteroidales bacterium]